MTIMACMKQLFRSSSGFTLVEVLTSILLLLIVWTVSLNSMVNYKHIDSFAKHKIEAAYVAQRILEEQRRQPFANLVTRNYGPVSIDTRGTFNSSADDLIGVAKITVTILDAYRKRVQIEVSWPELSAIGTVTKKEYYATDIANELELN